MDNTLVNKGLDLKLEDSTPSTTGDEDDQSNHATAVTASKPSDCQKSSHKSNWNNSLKGCSLSLRVPRSKSDCRLIDDKEKETIQIYRANSNLESEGSEQKGIERHGYGCCKFCVVLLKCTGILCYIFCCPPVPEIIARKLAFHPLDKGQTYVVSGVDIHGNNVKVKNAKKASKLTSLKFEPQILMEGRPLSTRSIQTSIIKTKRGSYLPILKIKLNPIWDENDETRNLVVLFSQPNSSDLGCYFQPHGINLRNISDLLQVTVYAYDYSGYGISTGSPSEKNIYSDIEAAYKHIFETEGPNVRIALLGYSIGTVPTVHMASKHPQNLCGVILVAPLASALRLYTKRAQGCCMDRFLNYEMAAEVNVPVLICHGKFDDVIPPDHSEMLLKRFPRAVTPLFVNHANHLTIFSGRYLSVFWRIRRFLVNETDSLQHCNAQ
ncbi:unnamed protein product [Thelazia callipaeda]|uniref:Hydrolase_4 domain-containing protein n=1 Tax=Thelazia callipaeda TaxID=103827 RepID=A0A158RD29_THECL|nr:unnamed protein product [Thelazia callipaeda]